MSASAELTYPWLKVRQAGLKFVGAPPFEEWRDAMITVNHMGHDLPWWRGDLYLAGEKWYGEDRATSIFDPLEWDLHTWQNNASVVRRIPSSRRRDPPLSYSHHAEVAYLEPDSLQDQYLQRAIDNQLSVRQLRELIDSERGSPEEAGEEVQFEVGSVGQRVQKEIQRLRKLAKEVTNDAAVYQHIEAAAGELEQAATVLKERRGTVFERGG